MLFYNIVPSSAPHGGRNQFYYIVPLPACAANALLRGYMLGCVRHGCKSRVISKSRNLEILEILKSPNPKSCISCAFSWVGRSVFPTLETQGFSRGNCLDHEKTGVFSHVCTRAPPGTASSTRTRVRKMYQNP